MRKIIERTIRAERDQRNSKLPKVYGDIEDSMEEKGRRKIWFLNMEDLD